MDQQEIGKSGLTKDWMLRLLLGIVAFFMMATYFTVQKTSQDVVNLETHIQSIQDKYESLNDRVKILENNSIDYHH